MLILFTVILKKIFGKKLVLIPRGFQKAWAYPLINCHNLKTDRFFGFYSADLWSFVGYSHCEALWWRRQLRVLQEGRGRGKSGQQRMRRHPVSSVMKMTAATIAGVRRTRHSRRTAHAQTPSQLRDEDDSCYYCRIEEDAAMQANSACADTQSALWWKWQLRLLQEWRGRGKGGEQRMRRHPVSSVMKMTAASIAGVRRTRQNRRTAHAQTPSQLRAAALCVQSVEKRPGTLIATSGEGWDMLTVSYQCCGSGSGIRDPGSGIGCFLTPGSGIRDPE